MTESYSHKSAQYRNMRIATLVPEMLQGVWQKAVLLHIKEQPVC